MGEFHKNGPYAPEKLHPKTGLPFQVSSKVRRVTDAKPREEKKR